MHWYFGLRVGMIGWMFAAAPQEAGDDANMRLIGNGLLLVGALLIGALVIAWAQKWRRSMTEGTTTTDVLGSFRSSYERGELSEDEYRRIKTRMSGAKLPSSARPEQTPGLPDSPQSDARTPEPPAAE